MPAFENVRLARRVDKDDGGVQWIEAGQMVRVEVGLNYFEISDTGLVRARDLDAYSFVRSGRALRCAVTPRWSGVEEVFALQFSSPKVATEAEAKLRLAAHGAGAFESQLEVSDEELVAVLMDPGFLRIVDQVARLLSLGTSSS